MQKLIKDLHYLSIGLAEARLRMADIDKLYPDEVWKNVNLCLMGANTNIETAIGDLYRIKENKELKNKELKEKIEVNREKERTEKEV